VGHAEGWSTAQARYGLCQRVTGVQHPAPTLTCSLARTHDYIHVSAPHALPVADGRALQPEVPASELWALLYVQLKMADGGDVRNVLIGRTRLRLEQPRRGQAASAAAHASGYWDQTEIDRWLTSLALPQGLPLSAVAVELLPEPQSPFADPLGKDLGEVRVLRVSPLTPVPAICLDA
jgi:hypothetical protein